MQNDLNINWMTITRLLMIIIQQIYDINYLNENFRMFYK